MKNRVTYIAVAALTTTCVVGCAARRWTQLSQASSNQARISILRLQAQNDQALAGILGQYGTPETVDVHDYGSSSAEIRLLYPDKRKRVVLTSVPGDQGWQVARVELVSSLPAYRERDTVEGYEEYLAKYPDDPPDDIESARARIRQLQDRQAALAKLEEFIRSHPHGNDIAEVCRALEVRSQLEVKSEFETTRAYRERVAAAQTRSLLGGLAMDAPFIFEVQKESVTYNADAQQLEIVLKFARVWNGMNLDRNAESLPSRLRERSRGSYIGTNAFGAVVDVSTSSFESYALVVKNVASLPTRKEMPEYLRESYERARRDDLEMRNVGIQIDTASTYESSQERFLRTTVSLGPEDAKRAKADLRVFAISRLAAPFTSKGDLYSPARFDKPSEFYEEVHYVHVEVIALWFYDPATRRVLTRIDV